MKAIALFSGGLDSMLAIRLIKDQGIEVTAIHLDIGFGGKEDNTEIKKRRAEIAGADFQVIDIKEQFLQDVLFSPKYGYGKNFNPCIDCHGNMVRVAKGVMERLGASFIITGEVLGQRPKSQRMEAIKQVTSLASEEMEEGIVLRPLCAKLMPETKPELEGWVDREKLLAISGRGREVQLSLAKQYGFDDYESPGGGCLLTDENYAKKLKDFIEYDNFQVEDIEVLKVGRHFRLPDGAKLVIGKDQADNERMKSIDNSKMLFARARGISGPLSMISKSASKSDRALAAVLITTYARSEVGKSYEVLMGDETLTASPLSSKTQAHRYFL
jgi:tRNA-specific 2-thiouridylase